MRQVFYFLGFLWVLPISILAWIILLLFKFLGQIKTVVVDYSDFSFTWIIQHDSILQKASQGWFGATFGNNLVLVYDTYEIGKGSSFCHEKVHLKQYYIFGIFFLLVYICHSAIIFYFQKDKNCYYDNFLEKWARKEAGQRLEIPRSDWKGGPEDRFPWF